MYPFSKEILSENQLKKKKNVKQIIVNHNMIIITWYAHRLVNGRMASTVSSL